MSRTSRIPYHQNVYDLLQLEPSECPEAARMIAEHEAKHGPLPASVREWYLVPKVVPLRSPDDIDARDAGVGTLWHECCPHDNIGQNYRVEPLADVLRQFANVAAGCLGPSIDVLSTYGYYTWTWVVALDGSDDPPVWLEPDRIARDGEVPKHEAATFSAFLAEQLAEFYTHPFNDYTHTPRAPEPVQACYLNGLWLRSPAEPFEPAVIDFLIDQFGEPDRTPRPGNVTTFTFRPEGGIIRITADEPSLGGGLSAWWVHADTSERLTELARLIVPFGTLRETLRADTEPARAVLTLLQK
jgi:hypothetical protein